MYIRLIRGHVKMKILIYIRYGVGPENSTISNKLPGDEDAAGLLAPL